MAKRSPTATARFMAKRHMPSSPTSSAGPETEGETFVVMMDQMPITVMFVDQPLPVDAYEESLALNLVWPEAHDAMRVHKAHAVVALIGDPQEHLGNLNGAAAVTLVARALATLLPTAAVISTEEPGDHEARQFWAARRRARQA